MEQTLLLDNAKDQIVTDPDDEVIASESEVRELARECLSLPDPPGAEPPLLKAKQEQAARANGAHLRGMVAKWALYETAKGHISIHDPGSGEWHDVALRHAPGWAKWEARRRADLYRNGGRHAYDLTSAQMEEIWQEEHPAMPEQGIVEDHPEDPEEI